MARVRIHIPCGQPVDECGCPPDDDDDLEPGTAQDGSEDEDAA